MSINDPTYKELLLECEQLRLSNERMRKDVERLNTFLYNITQEDAKMDITTALACKLASIVVHAEEMMSPEGHVFDKSALDSAIADEEVQQWIKSLGALAPSKRPQETQSEPQMRAKAKS